MNRSRIGSLRIGWAGCLSLAVVLFICPAAQGTYDPHHGRWFQRDPLGARPDAPRAMIVPHRQYGDGMNFYTYVRGKPTRLLDAKGLEGDPAVYCKTLVEAVVREADNIVQPMPCTKEIVKHYLYGTGEDLPCPSACNDALAREAKARAEPIVAAQAYSSNPCKTSAQSVPLRGNINLDPHKDDPQDPDLHYSIGKGQYRIRFSGNARCDTVTCPGIRLAYGIQEHNTTCCVRYWAQVTAWMDKDLIEYKHNAPVGTKLGRLLNECAAYLDDWGLAKPFNVTGCKARTRVEGDNCKCN